MTSMNSFITRIVTNMLEGNVPSVMRKVMPSLIGTFVSSFKSGHVGRLDQLGMGL